MRKDFASIDAGLGTLPPVSRSDSDEGPPTPPLSAYEGEVEPQRAAPASGSASFFPASEFFGKDVPERSWIADDLIPGRTVTLLAGDGGTGKSLLSLQLAVAVATDSKWLDRKVTAGPVLYISAEDDVDELHRRLASISKAQDIGLDAMDRVTLCSLAGEDALMAFVDARTGILHASPLYDEITRQAEAVEPVLIVLDTLADLFPGNENDRAQARQFVGLLRGLAMQVDCAILLLSHPSLSGLSSGSGMSGSTAWNNSVRSRLYFSRVVSDGYEADTDVRVLRTMKANYGPTGDDIPVRWKGGVFMADVETNLDRVSAKSRAERVFLKLLNELNEQGRRVNHAGGPSYAPNVFAANPGAEGCTKEVLARAMETLLAAGQIVISEDGPPSKRRQFLEVSR